MLSIVIPALNEAESLTCLLPYVLARCPQAEVIVVDGDSADETRDVVSRFPRVRLLASARGRAKQMNAGAQAAQGDVLLFLHADTVLPPGTQAAVREALADPGVVGGRFDVRFDCKRPIFRIIATLMNLRSRLSGISTGDQAIFVRRHAFATLGGYPDIPLMEDIEFTRRLKRQGRLACLGAQVITSSRKWEREEVLRTILLMWMLRFLYFVGADPAWLHTLYYGRPRRTLPEHLSRCAGTPRECRGVAEG
jgi:rSAM/selenodomain-associated transferase 2